MSRQEHTEGSMAKMGTFQAPRVKASHRDWGWFEHAVPWASDKNDTYLFKKVLASGHTWQVSQLLQRQNSFHYLLDLIYSMKRCCVSPLEQTEGPHSTIHELRGKNKVILAFT